MGRLAAQRGPWLSERITKLVKKITKENENGKETRSVSRILSVLY